MEIKGDERVTLVGKTGSGKTYAAERLTSNLSRLVVLDPKGMLKGKWGLVDWKEGIFSDTARMLKRGDPIRVRVPYPFSGDWEPYLKAVYEAGGCTLYLDEVYGVTPPGKPPNPYLTAVYTRGRELGIGVFAASQRPSWVPLFVRSEAEWIFAFRLLLRDDRKRIAEVIGLEPEIPASDPYGFYLYHSAWQLPRYYKRLRTRKEK